MFLDILIENETANVYAFGSDGKNVVLIDPGSNSNNHLIKHLDKMGLNVVAVILTHGHYDHIGALEDIKNKFPDCQIYMHGEEFEFLYNDKLNLSFRYSPININLQPIELFDGNEIELTNLKIRVIHTPFHTRGSICLYIEKEKVLFSGDTLFARSIGRTDLPTGSEKTISKSLSKLIDLGDDVVVYPGHGPKTTLGIEKKYNSYLRFLY